MALPASLLSGMYRLRWRAAAGEGCPPTGGAARGAGRKKACGLPIPPSYPHYAWCWPINSSTRRFHVSGCSQKAACPASGTLTN